MPANKLVSERQLEVMVDYMENNRDFAVGRLLNSGPLAKQQMLKKWEEVAAILNAVGVGTTKPAGKWRDYWTEKKYVVRRKASMLRLHASGTGGGPSKKGVLTPLEERILAILGKVSVQGNPVVQIPFEDIDVPPSALTTSQGHAPPDVNLETPPVTMRVLASSTYVPQQSSPPPAPPTPSPPPCTPPAQSLQNLPEPTVGATPGPQRVPPRHSRGPRRSHLYERHSEVPEWALNIEQRRMETAETQASALTQIAAALTEMAASNQATATAITDMAATNREIATNVTRITAIVSEMSSRQVRIERILEAFFRPDV